MRLVGRELCPDPRVALAAGGDDAGAGEVRPGVGDGEDVVGTVAVVAGGHVRGDVRPAERHGLPVVGFPVVLEAVLVAAPADLVALALEMHAAGRLDLVRRVAVGADRPALVALGQELPVHALVVDALDADVALAARARDMGVVGPGALVDAALDVVHAVAVVAGRGDDQAHLQQRPAVDAVEVVHSGVRVSDPVLVGQLRVAVAGGAGPGQIELEDRRVDLPDRGDFVGVAVAAHAGRRARGAHRVAHAVNAGRVGFRLLRMAGGALRRRQRGVVRRLGDRGMAVDAVELPVHRLCEGRRADHLDAGRCFLVRLARRGGFMAFHAGGIGDRLGGGERRGPRQGREAQDPVLHAAILGNRPQGAPPRFLPDRAQILARRRVPPGPARPFRGGPGPPFSS